MPNSPLLLNYLCFDAHFLQESRLTTEVFILAFWFGCVLLPWQRGWLKQSFAHYELTLNPFCQQCSDKKIDKGDFRNSP